MGRGPHRRARAFQRGRGRRRAAPAGVGGGSPPAPARNPAAAGCGSSGGLARRRRPRLYERSRQRARRRLAQRHVRLPFLGRGLASRRLPRGRAAQERDLGRLRLVATLVEVTRRLAIFAAALAFATPALAAIPRVHARAYLLEDGGTGDVLARYHDRARVPVASLTKLMTVLLTVERTKPSDVVTVAPGAAAVGESSIDLAAGEKMTVRELLEGALIQSANDAADALAYYVGKGSEARFVAMMNARARQLGLRDTHFARPDGLDAPGHYSSARDVTFMARLLMHRPAVRQIVRQRVATIFGVKTGHTAAAGWSEVGAAHRNGVSIYAALLGSPDRGTRNEDLAELLDW